MDTPDRLALRREPDKSFALLGAVTVDTKSEVTVRTPDGAIETYPRGGLMFVTVGSLNHFARLDPEGLQAAFAEVPRSVFEQALVDATTALGVTDIKKKLTHAGLASAAVDKAWDDARRALETSADVKISGEGAARKFAWKGARSTRLRPYVDLQIAEAAPERTVEDSVHLKPAPVRSAEATQSDTSSNEQPSVRAESSTQRSTSPTHASDSEPAHSGHAEPGSEELLLATLANLLGQAAPTSLDQVAGSVLRIGDALSAAPAKDLKALVEVPEDQRPLVSLLLLGRDREIRLWPAETETILSAAAGAVIESAIGEASRSSLAGGVLARFTVRVLQRTDLRAIPLTLVASAFVRSASAEDASDPSAQLLDLAGLLADRVKVSVGQEWDQADPLVRDIARGMNRIALDEAGPRSRFLAALFDIRRKHLGGDLLWKHVDMSALDLAAGGVMRRALLDPVLADRVVEPEVVRFISECSTRHDLGRLIALRGSFAQYVGASDMIAVMARVARDDRKANEWFQGLRQQDRVDSAVSEREAAVQEATRAQATADEAERRVEKALADRDAAKAALIRASEANVEASDAQLRQAKLDVLRSLATLAVTITGSAAAKDDPALLQRLGFALRREGLTEIAAPGQTVTYDPALHDAQGEHIDPGTSVSVGRSGYTYDSGDESIVLVKPHVSVI